jgi:hypothetical protein
MTKKNEAKKQPLKAFRAFGIEATVWPPHAECGEDAPKIRIGRSFRDKNGAFKTTTYFSPEELAVWIEQALKVIAFTAPGLVDQTMQNLADIARQEWK